MKAEQKQAITELAELLHQNNLSEIEYDVDGVHLRVVGHRPVAEPTTVVAPVAEKNVDVPAGNYIRSPMVGVAYLAKDQNSAPFVAVGDTVVVGQTVCLIEAMKTFNPIKAEKAGQITEILIETGNPVEYNQPLFRIG
ncbi:MAG: acetyl-CoA carboxylase biotin carboxyl carrier protein [Alphaproteobacteria bacterium]|nr:acetyl-CoA carboxylase biotin carboxyl carrier protein [Alphaproteobacteria bacterium]